MKIFSAFFLGGSLFGLFTHNNFLSLLYLAPAIVLLILYSFSKRKNFIFLLLTGFLAFYWGFIHHSPVCRNSINKGEIQANGILFGESSRFIVGNGQMLCFCKGFAKIGTQGCLQTYKKFSFLNKRHCKFTNDKGSPSSHLFQRGARKLQSFLKENLFSEKNLLVKEWYKAFFMGIIEPGSDMAKAFKYCGLLHILVISGTHVSLFALIVLNILHLSICVLYSLRLISPNIFYHIRHISEFFTLSFLLLFIFAIQSPISAERALMACAVGYGCKIKGILLKNSEKILSIFVAQILLFPLGIANESSLLSWISYLTVLRFSKLSFSLRNIFLMNLELNILSFIVVGNTNAMSFLFNVVITPLIPLLCSCSLICITTQLLGYKAFFLITFQASFLKLILLCGEYCKDSIFLLDGKIVPCFWLLALLGTSLFLSNLSKLCREG